jgi:ceramide glucosyltransferase
VHGKNLKVSNLINLAERAKYGRIVIADSDIAVQPDYLERVTAPLADPSVGVVTCLYHARSVGGFWTRIGAQFVDAWFAPSVRITHLGRSSRFGFGATLAVTRDTLDRIGGFLALKDELADDFWLAELPRRLGRRTVLSEVDVATDVIEPSFGPLWHRETRWLRTIRSLNPMGFAFLFITFTVPWLAIGAALALRRTAPSRARSRAARPSSVRSGGSCCMRAARTAECVLARPAARGGTRHAARARMAGGRVRLAGRVARRADDGGRRRARAGGGRRRRLLTSMLGSRPRPLPSESGPRWARRAARPAARRDMTEAGAHSGPRLIETESLKRIELCRLPEHS